VPAHKTLQSLSKLGWAQHLKKFITELHLAEFLLGFKLQQPLKLWVLILSVTTSRAVISGL